MLELQPYILWPVAPYQGLRGVDAWGAGGFGAPREGKDDGHPGVDAVGKPGDRLIQPIPGQLFHIGIAYPGETLGSIHIKGIGIYADWRIKLFYASTKMPRYSMLGQGFALGEVQDRALLATRRNPKRGPMINHVHLGLWIDDKLVDPTSFMRHP